MGTRKPVKVQVIEINIARLKAEEKL